MNLNLKDLLSIEGTALCEFRKGEYLIREGEIIENIFYLLQGSCKRVETSVYGDEITFNTKQANRGIYSLVGLNGLYTAQLRSESTFIAKTRIRCYKINAEKAKSYICQQPEILLAILYMNRDSYSDFKSSFTHRIKGRTANFFCKILLDNIVELNGQLYLDLNLTNLELSQRLGVHQVTIARIMTILKKEKVIERNSIGIQIINHCCLKEYAEGKNLNYQE